MGSWMGRMDNRVRFLVMILSLAGLLWLPTTCLEARENPGDPGEVATTEPASGDTATQGVEEEEPVPEAELEEVNPVSEAKDEAQEEAVPEAEEVVISPEVKKRSDLETPEKVSVVKGEELERKGSTTVTDAMRYEAGIRVDNGPLPFMENLTIRGFGGGRVLLTVDGVRTLTFGGIHGGGFNVDIGAVKAVEVIRGPASTLYGSRAVGGVVNIITRLPEEMLLPGRHVGARFSSAFKSDPMSAREGLLVFGDAPGAGLQWQLGVTREDAGDFTDSNGEITSAGWNSTSANGKLLWRSGGHEVVLQGNWLMMNPLLNDGTNGLVTPDWGKIFLKDRTWKEIQQLGGNLAYRYSGSGFLREARFLVYLSGGQTRDFNDDIYVRAGMKDLYYLESEGLEGGRLLGAEGRLKLDLMDRPTFHWDLTTGVVVEQESYHGRTDKVTEIYESPTQLTLVDTVEESVAFYPNTDFLSVAGFLLSDLSYKGRLILTPGLRTDFFFITPDAGTPDFDTTNMEGNLDQTTDYSVSPRVGLVYKPISQLALSAMVARGFFVTGATTRYYNFYHSAGGGFYIQGNPDLEPEYSWNYEVGMKAKWGRNRVSLSGFLTDADGFVDLRLSQDDQGRLMRRYENVSNVRVFGSELEFQAVRFLWNFDFTANATVMDGTQEEVNEGVATQREQFPVVPWFMSGSLRWQDQVGSWGYALAVSVRAQGQQLGTVLDDGSNAEVEPPAGFWLMDFGAGVWWKDRLRLNAGVTNLWNAVYQEPLNRLSYSAPRVFFVSIQGTL